MIKLLNLLAEIKEKHKLEFSLLVENDGTITVIETYNGMVFSDSNRLNFPSATLDDYNELEIYLIKFEYIINYFDLRRYMSHKVARLIDMIIKNKYNKFFRRIIKGYYDCEKFVKDFDYFDYLRKFG